MGETTLFDTEGLRLVLVFGVGVLLVALALALTGALQVAAGGLAAVALLFGVYLLVVPLNKAVPSSKPKPATRPRQEAALPTPPSSAASRP